MCSRWYMGDDNSNGNDDDPSRAEVAEYVHDIAGQLAEMARQVGLSAAAEALGRVQRAIETDF
jgi:hypothetical protein